MKILLIAPAHPLRGGIAASSERLALAFQAAGHQVEILSFSLQYPAFLFPGTTQFTDDPTPSDLQITTALNSINPLNWIILGKKYSQKQFDMVICRYWLPFMSPCLGTFLRFFKGKTPIITLADNIIPHEKRIGDRQFTAYFLATCDAVVAMSNAVVEDARQFVPEKPIVFHPHPLYDTYGEALPQAKALQKLQLSPDYKYLLFFGFIRAYKGLDLLLEALADSRLANLPLKLIIAGEFYENPEKYEQLIQKYNLEQKLIRATHFIAADQVATYFSAADLIVQPYKSATQSGVSQVAYHFEKPIVVTNVGGLAEIIPHKKVGYVVEVQTEAIATAIADFFSKDKDINWTANIQEEKHRFRWESMVAVFTDLQKQLQKKC